MKRLHNFCAGPCTLPVTVLEQLADDIVDFKGSGMSLIEMSHRAQIYDEIHHGTVNSLRRLYGAPDDVDILLLQGGASLQFAMAPMNVLGESDKAGYVLSGTWGKKAYEDAQLCGTVYPAWTGAEEGYSRMPDPSEIIVEDDTRYLHVTSNETIGGIRMADFHDHGVRQVADMSSDYLSRPEDSLMGSDQSVLEIGGAGPTENSGLGVPPIVESVDVHSWLAQLAEGAFLHQEVEGVTPEAQQLVDCHLCPDR